MSTVATSRPRRRRFARRPTTAEVQALLDQARAMYPAIHALRDYERNARDHEWADMGDNFTTFAMFADKDASTLIMWLEKALVEARPC